LAACLINIDILNTQAEIIELCERAKTGSTPNAGELDPSSRSAAFANLSKVYLATGSNEKAEGELAAALENAAPEFRPALRIMQIPLVNEGRAEQISKELAGEIIK
jgi:hypothetical protein